MYMELNNENQVNKRISQLEKEVKEIKEILKNVMKLYDARSVKFINSVINTTVSKY